MIVLFCKHTEINHWELQDVNNALQDEFKLHGGVEMYSHLPDFGDFRSFYLPSATDLAAVSKRIFEGFAKPSWLAL